MWGYNGVEKVLIRFRGDGGEIVGNRDIRGLKNDMDRLLGMKDVFGELMIGRVILGERLNDRMGKVSRRNERFVEKCRYGVRMVEVSFRRGKVFDEIRIEKFESKVKRENIGNWNGIDSCSVKRKLRKMMRKKEMR